MAAGEAEQPLGEAGRLGDQPEEVFAAVQPEVDGDLVVAAAAGVDAPAELAQGFGQAALDRELKK